MGKANLRINRVINRASLYGRLNFYSSVSSASVVRVGSTKCFSILGKGETIAVLFVICKANYIGTEFVSTRGKLLTELTDEGLIHYLLLRYLRISTAQAAKIIAPLIT